jgi:surface protein
MFQDATSFNQPLNKWNVSNVTNMWMMFNGATSFNQPLDAPWYHEE